MFFKLALIILVSFLNKKWPSKGGAVAEWSKALQLWDKNKQKIKKIPGSIMSLFCSIHYGYTLVAMY